MLGIIYSITQTLSIAKISFKEKISQMILHYGNINIIAAIKKQVFLQDIALKFSVTQNLGLALLS